MSRTATLLIIFWNIVLSILLGYMLLADRSPVQVAEKDDQPEIEEVDTRPAPTPIITRDTAAALDARIAFFSMDSVQEQFLLVKESAQRVQSEARRLEGELTKEMQRAQARQQELATKDHTYSTQEQLRSDQEEYQRLEMQIQELRVTSRDKMEELQIRMLTEIGKEVEAFLEEYNNIAHFDYIFSIASGGQIWVGNTDLDITSAVVNGLNARHRERKDKK